MRSRSRTSAGARGYPSGRSTRGSATRRASCAPSTGARWTACPASTSLVRRPTDRPRDTCATSVVDAVEIVAAIFDRHRDLLRAFMHLGAVDDVISQRGSESSRELSRQFKAIVLEHRDEIGHADPDTAVDIAFRIAYCTFARQIMYGPEFESDLRVSWEELVPEVAAACVAYLLGPGRSSRARRRRTSAEPRRQAAALTDRSRRLYKTSESEP